MEFDRSTPLVSVQELHAELDDPNLRLVDASWHMPSSGRNAREEFLNAHIPNAVFFDIDRIAAEQDALPHMVAPAERFASLVGALGISDTNTIVVYDSVGLFSVARAWWNFKIMGARDCFVLDGGLPAWTDAGYPTNSGRFLSRPTQFATANAQMDLVADADAVENSLNDDAAQVVDVRGASRFDGEVEEPRPGLRSGHMPGAINVPFTDLIADGRLKTPDELRAIVQEAGVDPNRPVTTTCGSGVTAPIFNLALSRLGYDHLSVYDGSWSEWGGLEDRPVVKSNV